MEKQKNHRRRISLQPLDLRPPVIGLIPSETVSLTDDDGALQLDANIMAENLKRTCSTPDLRHGPMSRTESLDWDHAPGIINLGFMHDVGTDAELYHL